MNEKRLKAPGCPAHAIKIPKSREIVFCGNLKFPWKQDPKGYFLIKIGKELICCGFVNSKHKMVVEFRGKEPGSIIKEIAKRNLCNLENMGYISSELMIAHECLKQNKKYVQR